MLQTAVNVAALPATFKVLYSITLHIDTRRRQKNFQGNGKKTEKKSKIDRK